MTTPTKLPVIDAAAHVIETGRTWDYLEPSEQKFRPVLVPAPGLLYVASLDPIFGPK